uniref:Uncharacterized protein n=1 Tax=Yersinia enterocolitica W22703 TaxID=913028 RepID=F4N5H6_YEREN|nr:unknown protein [Yersinia enterocolitica W22703]
MHWHDKRLNKFNIGNIESLSGKNLINHFNPAPIIEKKDNQTLISLQLIKDNYAGYIWKFKFNHSNPSPNE